ncbi:MAG: hypothetical protein M3Y42_15610 [Actinomycetota bacterium]|nr:hypothetical protein [Actinomycetota bacterium]MDQ2958375.1 hypothetical protein [Actinomycetota bacterium]
MRLTIPSPRARAALVGTAAAAVLLASLAGCGSSKKTADGPATTPTTSQQSSQPTSQSSGQPAANPSAAGSPCGYATVAQLTTIFGGTVSPGALDTAPDVVDPTCKWTVTGANLGTGSGDIVIAVPAQLQDPTKFGYAKAGLPTAVDVPGVGDSAFYLPQTTSVNLLKGSKSLLVQAVFTNRPDPTKIKAEVIALAGAAAGNLS